MIGAVVLAALVLAFLLWRFRRRKAARSVAADGVTLALGALIRPPDLIGRHRAPKSRRGFAGSGGAM